MVVGPFVGLCEKNCPALGKSEVRVDEDAKIVL